MSLMRKKKFKFDVELLLAYLTDVPLVNAALFAKIRLLEGGRFTEITPSSPVTDHHVRWDHVARFSCQISSHPQTGILDTCLCRVSVRKEIKGGKSFEKLGFIDVNLSEYTGSGVDGRTRDYLLEGYNKGHRRQDNSKLRVNVAMRLQSADPFFKVPTFEQGTGSMQNQQVNPADRRAHDWHPEPDEASEPMVVVGTPSDGEENKEDDLMHEFMPSTSTGLSLDTMTVVGSRVPRPNTIGIGTADKPAASLSATPSEADYTSLIDDIAASVALSSATPLRSQASLAQSNATPTRSFSMPYAQQQPCSSPSNTTAGSQQQPGIGSTPQRTKYDVKQSASDARLIFDVSSASTRMAQHRHSCAAAPGATESSPVVVRRQDGAPPPRLTTSTAAALGDSLPRRVERRSLTPNSSSVPPHHQHQYSPGSASHHSPSSSSTTPMPPSTVVPSSWKSSAGVQRTRVDAEELIDDIVEEHLHLSALDASFGPTDSGGKSRGSPRESIGEGGLQLYISRETGAPLVGATSGHLPGRNFERVVIEQSGGNQRR